MKERQRQPEQEKRKKKWTLSPGCLEDEICVLQQYLKQTKKQQLRSLSNKGKFDQRLDLTRLLSWIGEESELLMRTAKVWPDHRVR